VRFTVGQPLGEGSQKHDRRKRQLGDRKSRQSCSGRSVKPPINYPKNSLARGETRTPSWWLGTRCAMPSAAKGNLPYGGLTKAEKGSKPFAPVENGGL